MDWEASEISQFEFCNVAGATFYVGDDGQSGKPVFGAMFFFGESKELYRGHNLKAAKAACQEHLAGSLGVPLKGITQEDLKWQFKEGSTNES